MSSKNNWPTKKLGEVCDIVYGFAFKAAKFNEAGKGLPVIRIGDVDKNVTGKFFDGEYDQKYLVKNGDILLGLSGSFKANQWLGGKALLNQRVATLKGFENEVSEKFVFYQMPGLFLEFEKQITQLSVKNILTKHLNNLDVLYPPLNIKKQIVERLDKIAEARKLNKDLIQKSDELFQSLLHKELNPAGPADAKAMAGKKNWEMKKLKEILSNEKYSVGKLKRAGYQKSGTYPIIDQSVNEIAGYSENKEVVYSGKLPVVIYGDHTRIVKFVEHKFILGADGTKIFIPKDEVLAKYLYFVIQFFNVESHGYKRHFPILKEIKIPLPPLETQKQIVAKLSAVQEYKKGLLEQKAKLKELFDSALHKSMTQH